MEHSCHLPPVPAQAVILPSASTICPRRGCNLISLSLSRLSLSQYPESHGDEEEIRMQAVQMVPGERLP